MVLNISRQAIVNAGPDDTICVTQGAYPIAAATASLYTSLQWATSGDGTFNNTALLQPVYTPGATDVAGGSVVLTLTASSASPCVNAVDAFTLNIVGILAASAGPDVSLCLHDPYTLSGASAVNYSSLQWSHNGPGTLLNPTSVHPTYVPAPGEAGTVTCTLRAYNTYCNDSITDQMTLLIHPLLTAAISGQATVCQSTSVPITIVLTGSAPWTVRVVSASTDTTISGITASPFTYTTVPPAGLNTYVLASVTDAFCSAIAAHMNGAAVFNVTSTPVIDFSENGACAEDTTYFSVTGNFILATSYWHWDFGDGTFWTCNAPGCGPAAHVFPAPGTYTVTLFVQDTNGCSYSVSHLVNVRPQPNAFFSFSTPDCLNSTVFFTELCTNPPGQGYLKQWEWNFGDGTPVQTFTFPTSPNTSHIYTEPGNYPVTLKVTNSVGCSDHITYMVTVTPTPTADFSYTKNCQNGATLFTDMSLTNSGGNIVSHSWDFGDPASGTNNFSTAVNPTHTYLNTGYHTVKLIVVNANGCSDTLLKQVFISPAPLAEFSSSPGCVNAPTFFWADSTLINISAVASYAWQFGDGATANTRNTQHAYLAAGTYQVTLTVKDTVGCEASVSHFISVNVPPAALFSVNASNCAGQPVLFTNLSTPGSGYNTLWMWEFGDGTSQSVAFPAIANVSHTYINAGSYVVTLTVTNSMGCTSFVSKTVVVSAGPQTNFMFAGNCQGSAVVFTDLSVPPANGSISAWAWNFGDPASGINNSSSLQNPAHVFAGPGTYVVKLITWSNSGCPDTLTKNILIRALPAVNFTTQGSCQNTAVLFVPDPTMIPATIASRLWQFGDGATSTLPSPTHTYTAAGNYTATLTVTDTAGCSNTISKVLAIAAAPMVNFTSSAPGCSQTSVTFTDLTTVSTGYISSRTWNFGDGTSQTFTFPDAGPVTHTYAFAGTFNVTLTVNTSNGCSNAFSKIITISPRPVAAFAFDGGCQGTAVAFNDLSTAVGATIANRLWNFGDPASGSANSSSLVNPSHTYSLAGTYTVKLIVTTAIGCSDTTTQVVTVADPPAVDFSSTNGCNNDTTLFNSSSFVNMATTASWLWNFGDGLSSSLPDPVHVYAASGTYTVTLTIVNSAGCPASKTKTVTVTPAPVAAFAVASNGCAETEVTFTDLSAFNGGTITLWNWSFGDGTTASYSAATPSVSHSYSQPGNFVVTLTVYSQNGCENTSQQMVTIAPAPLAAFTYLNTCAGSATQFTNSSVATAGINITSRLWNFGDPASGINNTSSLMNPAHTFAAPGTYPVTLVVVNASGCSDTVVQQLTITPKPGVDFYHSAATCLGTPMAFFTDTTVTAIASVQSYEWNFGDGSPVSNLQNPVHSFAFTGTFTVTLSIVDAGGCSNAISHTVTIGEAPVSVFSYAQACKDAPTLFTDLSYAPNNQAIVSWKWDFGVNGILSDTSIVQNPEFTYTASGTYTVTLTTATASGCSHTQAMPVQIFTTPTAAFTYATSPCSNGSVQFQDASYTYQGIITSWEWEFEPFQNSTAKNPVHQYYAVDSCYNVKLIIKDFRGCTDTTTRSVCVPAPLAVAFDYQNECFGSAMLFTPQVVTPTGDSLISFSWNFGDPQSGTANTSAAKKPAHTFTKTGFYTVSLSATDVYGCSASVYQSIEVKAQPVASFSYEAGQCDSTVTFTSTSVDTTALIATYVWNFGDGTTMTMNAPDNTVTHKFPSNGVFNVKLTVISQYGCSAEVSQPVEQKNCLVAAFVKNSSPACQNNLVAFADQSVCTGTITSWEWQWGDASAPSVYSAFKPMVTHVYALTGVYNVTLTVTTLINGVPFTATTTQSITVLSSPVADFTSSGSCSGGRVSFQNTSSTNGVAIAAYAWNFGDPANANDTSGLKNPAYTYPVDGDYVAQLVVTNTLGCADTVAHTIPMHGAPSADFNFSVACMGLPTHFFDQSDKNMSPITYSGWVVSDETKIIGYMTGQSASFTFSNTGDYTVMHTVSDSNRCADSIAYKITVVPSPITAFSIEEEYENIQGQIKLENGTLGGNEYLWDFGNGETSNVASPVITFNQDGEYRIQLYASNEYGCVDSTEIVYEMLFKGLWVPNALAIGPNPAVKIWKPVGVNLSFYKAEIYDRWGNLIWFSKKLTDKGAPMESWDGTLKDKPCPEGIYVWRITAIFSDGTIWRNDSAGNRDGLDRGELRNDYTDTVEFNTQFDHL